jgi:hypothetical protein
MLTDRGQVTTQGTHLYFVDTTGVATLIKLNCPTGITGVVSGARDTIEDTCLDETEEHTFVSGLATPAAISVPFNLVPADGGHQALMALKASGEVVSWMVLLSESDDPPTLVGSVLTAPATRSTLAFRASVEDLDIAIANNEIVRGTLSLRRRGGVTATWFEPA